LPFKCNLHRYSKAGRLAAPKRVLSDSLDATVGRTAPRTNAEEEEGYEVGLYKLNLVYP
jgi:hypothetical protein